MTTSIRNLTAWPIFLAHQGLSDHPGRVLDREGLYQLIHDLGFTQVNSIATVFGRMSKSSSRATRLSTASICAGCASSAV